EEVSRDIASNLLSRPDAHLWFHVDAPTEEELGFLQAKLKIHPLTLEDVVQQNQRPKIEPFADYVYLAIHALHRAGQWEIEPCELDLLLGHNWIVSVAYGPLSAMIEQAYMHARIPAALGRGPDFLLYTLVDLVVDSYFPILDDIEDEIDAL